MFVCAQLQPNKLSSIVVNMREFIIIAFTQRKEQGNAPFVDTEYFVIRMIRVAMTKQM